jgi:hemoglobin
MHNFNTTTEENTFSRIGGINGMHDVIECFYDKVLGDPLTSPFFRDANMKAQRGKIKAFLMMALGGPIKFTGNNIRAAHLRLVANGLSDPHFDAVGRHLDASLQEHGVTESTRAEITLIVESCRKDVLNK